MKHLRFTFIALATCTLAAGGLQAHAAAHAAKVIYAFGQVQASTGMGKDRRLGKGDRVFPGETVATARGRAQIQFTDGGFASLQPNTEYRIDDYNFSGKADGKERSFLSLIKGSIRLVTGTIGKTNRKSFRIKTKVATIGIRGTSGKVSHCDSNCGGLPTGTGLQGYGGTWDLASGSFSGPVESGDAYVCDGTTCQQMQGGVAQREDVGDLAFDEEEDEVPYEQGQQVDSDGVQCDLGDACGNNAVVENQIGATFSELARETEMTGELVHVVLTNGAPTSFVAVNGEPYDADVHVLTIDVDGLRDAVNGHSDPDVVTVGNHMLDAVDAHTLEHLRSMPASIGAGDFGTTSDNILTKGRWTGGYVLAINGWLDPASVWYELTQLTGYQSEHFIYGEDPGVVPTGGGGIYTFTGGTFSTATDGSSIGLGATGGQLTWNFGLGSGSLNMTVEHGASIYGVSGSLLGDGTRSFTEGTVNAVSGLSTYPVELDGFLAGPNGSSPPLAAGLAYVIKMFYINGYDLVGTAGFGLTSTFTDTTVKYALNYFDGSYVRSKADGDGTADGASITTGPPLAFGTHFGDAFDQGGSTVVSGSYAPLAATWQRFSGSYNFTRAAVIPPGTKLDKFHAAYTTNPTADSVVGAMTGTATYNVIRGATAPTLNYGLGGATEESGTLMTASFGANFTTGQMDTVNLAGTFPDGSWTLTGGGVVLVNGWAPLTGGATLPTACAGVCSFVSGNAAYTFAGDSADGIVFSYHGIASGSDFSAWSGAGVVTP